MRQTDKSSNEEGGDSRAKDRAWYLQITEMCLFKKRKSLLLLLLHQLTISAGQIQMIPLPKPLEFYLHVQNPKVTLPMSLLVDDVTVCTSVNHWQQK